ncbi:ABC transporter ATP-binding protein [Marinactinospora rubrisoli]|uniref:ABC transporter ATP-binding protein n=1 Tax=Marinactinospora rubrisoli TaxID=2715399 RepID=A0ABW2KBJ9_9ACTN
MIAAGEAGRWDAVGAGTAAIRARGLRKHFAGVRAVRGVDLTVHAGESVALLGPKGSGKSTTIAMLGGLVPPSAGRAEVGGLDVTAFPERVRRGVGVVGAAAGDLDERLTAVEILWRQARDCGLSRSACWERAARMLEAVGLTDRVRGPVRGFTRDMRRRLEVARALVHDPEVLFLDEPGAGLDPGSRAEIWRCLDRARRRRGGTLVLATTEWAEAERCDRVAVLVRGRVVAEGPPDALWRDPPRRRAS